MYCPIKTISNSTLLTCFSQMLNAPIISLCHHRHSLHQHRYPQAKVSEMQAEICWHQRQSVSRAPEHDPPPPAAADHAINWEWQARRHKADVPLPASERGVGQRAR
jgi:hypothetical protein